jgi:undecaprenyl-diphosphatase
VLLVPAMTMLLNFAVAGEEPDHLARIERSGAATPAESTALVSPDVNGNQLSILHAVILGVVEGATEYLPVSSTGHLVIAQRALGLGNEGEDADAANALAICIQSGAILAVFVLYFHRIRQMLRGLFGGDREGLRLVGNLLIAFTPAAVIGLLFHDWIKRHLFGIGPVAAALIVGGLLILATAKQLRQRSSDLGKELHRMSSRDALTVGLMQCLAFWPGFSRSLATILGCLWTGLNLAAAVEFSFLLGLVTLSAATVFEGMQHGDEILRHYGWISPLVALVVAFVSAVLSVRFMIGVLGRFGLSPFGYYRIALALICLLTLFYA